MYHSNFSITTLIRDLFYNFNNNQEIYNEAVKSWFVCCVLVFPPPPSSPIVGSNGRHDSHCISFSLMVFWLGTPVPLQATGKQLSWMMAVLKQMCAKSV